MQPLTVNFKPSKGLASMLILAGFFAMSMVLLVPLAVFVKVGFGAGIAFCVWRAVRRYAFLQHANAILSLHVSHLNVASVKIAHHKIACTILPTTTVTPYLLIIQVKLAPDTAGEDTPLWQKRLRFFNPLTFFNTQSIVVLPDSIAGDYPEETMRQLRVWLRMASQHEVSQSN